MQLSAVRLPLLGPATLSRGAVNQADAFPHGFGQASYAGIGLELGVARIGVTARRIFHPIAQVDPGATTAARDVVLPIESSTIENMAVPCWSKVRRRLIRKLFFLNQGWGVAIRTWERRKQNRKV